MSDTPLYSSSISKQLPKFRAWLTAAGAELLEPTNPYEVLRFKVFGETSVIYRKASGLLRWTGRAEEAFGLFATGKNWTATEKNKAVLARRSPTIRALVERDGDDCFFCRCPMQPGFETIEHLVPRAHGGPNHISNFVLAHRACNAEAGHLSAMEKIRRRETALVCLAVAS